MDRKTEGRLVGGLMTGAALGSLVLMAHHPSSLDGVDDGRLMTDWSNPAVHAGMVVCMLAMAFAGGEIARRLDDDQLSVRAGRGAFGAGMGAAILAALLSGFVAPRFMGGEMDQALRLVWALNQTLSVAAVAMTGLATALWGIAMLRRASPMRITGGLGIAMGVLAAGWTVMGDGLGLHAAAASTLLLAIWSGLVASAMIRDRL